MHCVTLTFKTLKNNRLKHYVQQGNRSFGVQRLPYKIKTQYVQNTKHADTVPISGQSIPMVKVYMGICLIMVDTAFSY